MNPDPTTRAMLKALRTDDPWQAGCVRFGDCCHFCQSEHHDYRTQIYEHFPDCAWMAVSIELDETTDRHVFYDVPDNPHRAECQWCDWEDDAETHETWHDEWYPSDPPSGPRFPVSAHPIADLLPFIRVPRGGIIYFDPTAIPGSTAKPCIPIDCGEWQEKVIKPSTGQDDPT